jgi:hypothetical protein
MQAFMLRDAAELNPYNTKYFVFVDSGHMCAGAQDPEYMNVYTEHMDRGYLVTHWPYGSNTDVHGMCDKAMHAYVGTTKDPLKIVRGGVFGGRKQVPPETLVVFFEVAALDACLLSSWALLCLHFAL